MDLKQLAAEHAVAYVASGMKLGLGAGSTMRYVLDALALRLQLGALRDIVGVPASEATARQARHLGIPLTTLEEQPRLDLTVAGADEVAPNLNLINGCAGALLREKIVAANSTELLIVAEAGQRVERLGTRVPLPVEVLPFGGRTHVCPLERLGALARVRNGADGWPYCTDNGNYIIDCTFPDGIDDPWALAHALDGRPGIVGHGLFLHMATRAVIGTPEGVVVMHREE